MKKLRLLVTEDCSRNCAGCCNKQWDLKKLPVCTDFAPYDEIMLTGGEPLLYPEKVIGLVDSIRNADSKDRQLFQRILVYTAHCSNILHVLPYVDGVTLTLHDSGDVGRFKALQEVLRYLRIREVPWVVDSSMRLNVFTGVSIKDWHIDSWWKVKHGMEWIEDCPLPKDEVFMRVEHV